MIRIWLVVALVACKGERPNNVVDDDPRKLEELVDRYQIAIQDLAKAVAEGTCADKAARLAPAIARHQPVFEQLAAAVKQPKARAAIAAVVDARDAAISTPEIAFKQARHDCQDDAKFTAVIASMPR